MNYIVPDVEQTTSVAGAAGLVEVRGHDGRVLGILLASQPPISANEVAELLRSKAFSSATQAPEEDEHFTQEEIAEAKRRRAENKPGYTTQQVLDYLRTLENR